MTSSHEMQGSAKENNLGLACPVWSQRAGYIELAWGINQLPTQASWLYTTNQSSQNMCTVIKVLSGFLRRAIRKGREILFCDSETVCPQEPQINANSLRIINILIISSVHHGLWWARHPFSFHKWSREAERGKVACTEVRVAAMLGFQPRLAESKAHILISWAIMNHQKRLSDVSCSLISAWNSRCLRAVTFQTCQTLPC